MYTAHYTDSSNDQDVSSGPGGWRCRRTWGSGSADQRSGTDTHSDEWCDASGDIWWRISEHDLRLLLVGPLTGSADHPGHVINSFSNSLVLVLTHSVTMIKLVRSPARLAQVLQTSLAQYCTCTLLCRDLQHAGCCQSQRPVQSMVSAVYWLNAPPTGRHRTWRWTVWT